VQAIGNMIKQNSKNKIVLYVPIEKFTNQFVDSVKIFPRGKKPIFREFLEISLIVGG
jgi:chromosomal replication initiation ATPase DnaA